MSAAGPDCHDRHTSSARAYAEQRIASRAAGKREPGNHLTRETLRLGDDLLVARPFADERIAIEPLLEEPQSINGAAEWEHRGAANRACGGGLFSGGKSPEYGRILPFASLIQGHALWAVAASASQRRARARRASTSCGISTAAGRWAWKARRL